MSDSDQATMMGIILLESFRWRSLCVRYHTEAAGHPLIAHMCNCSAPNLEHLSLSIHHIENANSAGVNSVTDSPQIFQQGAPKLHFLRLRGVAIQYFRPELAHLVSLHLDQTRKLPLLYATFRNIITSSPYLSDLSVYGDIILPTAWADHDSLIYLPQLRSLRIFSESGAMYSGLLLGINAPILESLTLKSAEECDFDALWRLANRGNYSNLKYLHFSDFELSVTGYTTMFRTFPAVKEFSAVHLFPSESELLTALLYGMTPGTDGPIVPWPRLESLCFGFDLDGDNSKLSKVAAIRKSVGHPLSHFFLTMEDDVFRQMPWEDTSNAGDDVDVQFFAVDRPWPLNGVHGGDQDDTMFL